MGEILVQDITDTATVNRATFYDHYSDKFELFNSLVGADFQNLLEERNVCLDENCSSGLSAIVLAVGDYLQGLHRDHAACTRQTSSGPLIDAAVTLAIRRIVLQGLKKQAGRFPVPREVTASLVSGAIYGAVKEWLSKTHWQVDEAALLSLVQPILPLLERNAAPVCAAVAPRRKRSRNTIKPGR
ncbi:MAG TPA: TetR/AcrR family transcriptional regulator [Bryobacteraceae bacterium]|nr:TetR/AcrR family transcriptional regulator [Bryobacteraceae bacterium]